MTFDLTRLGDWLDLDFFANDLSVLESRLAAETRDVLPPQDQVFTALEACQPAQTRVVILGQDPYPTPGHAHGLAFSADDTTTPLPKSLANIFKELEQDIGAKPASPDLRFWAAQGVLLLNAVLTTPTGVARGHRGWGWESLTQDVMRQLDDSPRAFLLWGKDAQSEARHLSNPDHLILNSPHPSPLSAYRGFFGSRPFSKVNQWLKDRGEPPINWTDAP